MLIPILYCVLAYIYDESVYCTFFNNPLHCTTITTKLASRRVFGFSAHFVLHVLSTAKIDIPLAHSPQIANSKMFTEV